jgi:hypothetical protein
MLQRTIEEGADAPVILHHQNARHCPAHSTPYCAQ